MIVELTDQNFETVVSANKVMVDFWAPWCGPCNLLAPIIEEIAKEQKELTIGKVNVDDYPELASKHGVMSIPTLIFFDQGKPVDSSVGVVSKNVITKKLEQFSS